MTHRAQKETSELTGPLAGAGLKIRNVTISGQRTSVRLEPMMWDALDEICRIEKMSRNQVCTLVKERHAPGSTLTAAIRVFIVAYFWEAARNGSQTVPWPETGQLGRLLGAPRQPVQPALLAKDATEKDTAQISAAAVVGGDNPAD